MIKTSKIKANKYDYPQNISNLTLTSFQNDEEYMDDENAEEKEEDIMDGEEEDNDDFLGDMEDKPKKKSRKKKQSRKRKATEGSGDGENENDNENENDVGREKKKKKRKKSQSKKETQEVKEVQYDEDGNPIPEEPVVRFLFFIRQKQCNFFIVSLISQVLTREEEIHKEWEEEVKSAKGIKNISRKRRNEDAVKKEVEQYNNDIETLAERMSDAYRDDKEAIAQDKMAISKLQLLPEVVVMLHR